jgi:creatinine amidohydrolase
MALLEDACMGLCSAGADRVLLINWHEGNTPTLRLAADQVQRAGDCRVVIAEAHVITNQLFPDEMELTHAGSMETAGVLAYDEALVHLDEAKNETEHATGERGHALFRRRDVFPILKDFHEIAPTGWYGHPDTVTKDRADEIFARVADHIVAQAREIWSTLGDPIER